MLGRQVRLVLSLLACVLSYLCSFAVSSAAQTSKKPFTVADEIELTHFFELGDGSGAVSCSPDGNYFAVWTERGRLDLNLSRPPSLPTCYT